MTARLRFRRMWREGLRLRGDRIGLAVPFQDRRCFALGQFAPFGQRILVC